MKRKIISPPVPSFIVKDTPTKPQLADLRKTKVLLATSMSGAMAFESYVASILELGDFTGRYRIPLEKTFLWNESLISRGRNRIANFMLRHTTASHLMFVDADIRFHARDIFSMVLAKKDLIGGIYPMKQIDYDRIVAAASDGVAASKLEHVTGKFFWRQPKGTTVTFYEPIAQEYLGTGFLLITREALEKMKPECDSYLANYDETARHYDFFPTPIVNEEYLSEDYGFCFKAAQAGITPYLAPWVSLTHMGVMEHKGCFWCSQGAIIHDIKGK